MKEKSLDLWLRKILETEDQEISCSECFDRISTFVEQELVSARPNHRMKQVAIHLEQCRACKEEYELIRDLAQFESSNQLPSQSDLVKSFRPAQP